MIDIKLVRENPELIKKTCERRFMDVDVDAIVKVEAEYRSVNQEVQKLQAERNRLSKECKTNPEAREQVKQMKGNLSDLEKKAGELKIDLDEKVSWLPNLLSDEIPDGKVDKDNCELRRVGTIPTFDFKPKDHQELGGQIRIRP